MPRVDTAILAATIFLTCLMVNLYRYPVAVPANFPKAGSSSPDASTREPTEPKAGGDKLATPASTRSFTFGPPPGLDKSATTQPGEARPGAPAQAARPRTVETEQPSSASRGEKSPPSDALKLTGRQTQGSSFPSQTTSVNENRAERPTNRSGPSHSSSNPPSRTSSLGSTSTTTSARPNFPRTSNAGSLSTITKGKPPEIEATPSDQDDLAKIDTVKENQAAAKPTVPRAQEVPLARCDSSSGFCVVSFGTERAESQLASRSEPAGRSEDSLPSGQRTADASLKGADGALHSTHQTISLTAQNAEGRSSDAFWGSFGKPRTRMLSSSTGLATTQVESIPLIPVDQIGFQEAKSQTERLGALGEVSKGSGFRSSVTGTIPPASGTAPTFSWEKPVSASRSLGNSSSGTEPLRHLRRLPSTEGAPSPPSFSWNDPSRLPFYPSTGYE